MCFKIMNEFSRPKEKHVTMELGDRAKLTELNACIFSIRHRISDLWHITVQSNEKQIIVWGHNYTVHLISPMHSWDVPKRGLYKYDQVVLSWEYLWACAGFTVCSSDILRKAKKALL